MNPDTFNAITNLGDFSDEPGAYAKGALCKIAKNKKMLGLTTADILTALGEGSPKFSGDWMFYQVQSVATRFTGSIGATIIMLLGVGALYSILKATTSKLYTWFISMVQLGVGLSSTAVGEAETGLLRMLTGMKFDAVRDATATSTTTLSPDAFILAITAVLPGALAGIPTALASGLGTVVASGVPGGLSLSTTAPSTTPATTTASTTAAAANSAASGANSLASELTAGGSLATSLVNAIGSVTGSTATGAASTAAATAAGSSASDLSTALDTTDADTLASVDSTLTDATDTTDVTDVASDLDSGFDTQYDVSTPLNRLVSVVGKPTAKKVFHNLVKIARKHKKQGDFATLRQNNTSLF